jgi:glycosyltransferase involved in cell wall biosynthesis
MHLGIPVIASQVSAIPEVAGNAALYIHPENKVEIADAMYKIVTDTKLRAQLIENGKLRAQYFSWDLSAQKVAEIICGNEKKL